MGILKFFLTKTIDWEGGVKKLEIGWQFPKKEVNGRNEFWNEKVPDENFDFSLPIPY